MEQPKDLNTQNNPNTCSSCCRGTSRGKWMFIAIIVAFAAAMGYAYYAPGNHIAWANDLTQAKANAAATGKPILMEFSASWCPTCRAVKRNVWPDKRVEDAVNSRTIPLAVDVDAQKELAAKYGVNGIPAFIVTDATDHVLARAEGYLSADGVMALIDSAERAAGGGGAAPGVSAVPR